MIFDLLRDTPDPGISADICIVGAGAAGIALAVECVRMGKCVTLLEAGGEHYEDSANETYRGVPHGRPYRGMQQGRAKRLGGTTTLWGGQILELDESDFTARDWIADSGWPLQKEALQPHYARALELEGLANVIKADDAVWSQLNPEKPGFTDLELYLSRWCPEPNFARLHRSTLESQGVSVWLHATAVEAVCEDDCVRAVRVRSAAGREALFCAAEYVFCLGAMESSRFFLQPQRRSAPWHRSNLVGCHFQDHIDSNAATIVPKDAQQFHNSFDTIYWKGYKYSPKLKLTETAQRKHQLLNVGATVFSTEADGEAEKHAALKETAKEALRGRFQKLSLQQVHFAARSTPRLARQISRYALQHRAYHSPSASLHLRVHCEQQPCGSSAVRLTEERDAFGLYRTLLDWKIAPQEIESIRCFVSIASQALAPLAHVIPHPRLQEDRFVDQCEDSFHHMGGMRMDPSPTHGVVDTNLKVHGTMNCYVCSTAVYPSSGFSNPTHTLLALTTRLAAHLCQ